MQGLGFRNLDEGTKFPETNVNKLSIWELAVGTLEVKDRLTRFHVVQALEPTGGSILVSRSARPDDLYDH